jgi:general secretion pathway protein G
MAIIALLLSIVTPRYFHNVSRAEETVLKEDLALMREALDKYHADNNKYPDTLNDLVSKKYLRNIPEDPITQSSATWLAVTPAGGDKGGVFDIKSGAPGNGRDGTAYADW